MKSIQAESEWKKHLAEELAKISSILEPLGYKLQEHQLHTSGERYLMTRNKLVLVANKIFDGKTVIIKASDHPDGQKEIQTEKISRDTLLSLDFASEYILFPKEISYQRHGPYLLWITEYIPQDKIFVAHTIEEQFFLILRAFEAQESFHATTFEHLKTIRKNFTVFGPEKYIESFKNYPESVAKIAVEAKVDPRPLKISEELLSANIKLLERYANYLTHTDFVPHNFRVRDHSLYMLDCSSVHFGNKYEGWARLLNYMLIHNPELERILNEYIRTNRGKDEYLDLRLMRMYKIGYLLNYYAISLGKTSGDLHELTKLRISFWLNMLETIEKDAPPDLDLIANYHRNRDNLRSVEEKERQKEFAKA